MLFYEMSNYSTENYNNHSDYKDIGIHNVYHNTMRKYNMY